MQLPTPPPTPPEEAEYRDGRAFCKQPQELATERLQRLLTEVVVGCKERGRQVDGPLDHSTGKGWVKDHAWKGMVGSSYKQALRGHVVTLLPAERSDIARPCWRRAEGPGGRALAEGAVGDPTHWIHDRSRGAGVLAFRTLETASLQIEQTEFGSYFKFSATTLPAAPMGVTGAV